VLDPNERGRHRRKQYSWAECANSELKDVGPQMQLDRRGQARRSNALLRCFQGDTSRGCLLPIGGDAYRPAEISVLHRRWSSYSTLFPATSKFIAAAPLAPASVVSLALNCSPQLKISTIPQPRCEYCQIRWANDHRTSKQHHLKEHLVTAQERANHTC
jgi:hypothetical protein